MPIGTNIWDLKTYKNMLWKYLASLLLSKMLSFRLKESKGQYISKWKYEVVALPKIWMKKFEKVCPKYSGQNFSNFSFIFWAMRRLHIFILKFTDLYNFERNEIRATVFLKWTDFSSKTKSIFFLLTKHNSCIYRKLYLLRICLNLNVA